MERPQVSIVIITKNQKHFLVETIPILKSQDYPNFEIIVVDSGSTDGAIEYIKEQKVTLVQVPSVPAHLFNYAHALNIGIKKASGQIIVRIPGDATPFDTMWLKNLINPLLCFEKVALVFGKEIPRNKMGIYESLKSKITKHKKRKWFIREWELKYYAACMAFPKKLWQKHHFNEKWLWGEEAEWMSWAFKNNKYIVYEPEARIYHSHGLPLNKELQRAIRDFNLVARLIPTALISFNGELDGKKIKKQITKEMDKVNQKFHSQINIIKNDLNKLHQKYKKFGFLRYYPKFLNLQKEDYKTKGKKILTSLLNYTMNKKISTQQFIKTFPSQIEKIFEERLIYAKNSLKRLKKSEKQKDFLIKKEARKNLRIAFFTDTFLPQVNGVTSAIVNSTKGLTSDGHKIIIFAPKPTFLRKPKEIEDFNIGAEVVYVPSVPAVMYPNFRVSLPAFPVTLNKLRKFKPDIIHFHTPLTLGIEAIIAAKALNKPLVGTFHTFFMEKEYLKIAGLDKIGGEKVFNKIGWDYSNFFYNKADLVITPSRYCANFIKENGATKQITVIPNPIQIENRLPLSLKEKIAIKEKLGIPPENKVIIWLGRISVEKNLETLIKTFKFLRKNMDKVNLLLIGDGPARKKVESLAKEEIGRREVIITGIIPNQKLISERILEIGDLFFSPSTSETQGMSALEAMSFGLPLVVSDKRALPELVDGNGFVCKANSSKEMVESIKKLLSDQKMKEEMGKSSIRIAQKYSVENISEKLEKTYKELLDLYFGNFSGKIHP